MINSVFVDTSALIALLSTKDHFHTKSVEVHAGLVRERTPLITSDFVLLEFLAFASKPPIRVQAIRMVDRIRGRSRTDVVPCTRSDWDEAFSLYKKRSDKAWSLTDCASIILCSRLGIKRVFTTDEHFAQAGFVPLLQP